jgi:hypothetical protein
MTSINPDRIRERLLSVPERRDIVLGAIGRYNERLAKIKKRFSQKPGDERKRLQAWSGDLEKRIVEGTEKLAVAPANMVVKENLERDRSGKIFLDSIIRQVDAGASIEQVTAPIHQPSRVSNYKKAMDALRNKGVVVDVSERSHVGVSIRNAADYQIVLLGRQFNIPAPFSQTLIKDPAIGVEAAVRQYVEFLVEQEMKSIYDVDFDTLRANRRNPRFEKIRKHARALLESPEISGKAGSVLDDLMKFATLHIVPYRKTRQEFEEKMLIPERVYAAAFSAMDKAVNYLTLVFRGFDVFHQKTMLTTNNSMGLRMHIYSELLRNLAEHGVDVKRTDMTSISRAYAHGAEGEVMSRSGSRTRYDPFIRNIAEFEGVAPPDVYSRWVDFEGACHCKDSKYIGMLHQKRRHSFDYYCMHVVALACAYMERAIKGGNQVFNPLILPLEGQIDFEQRVAGKVLIVRKEDGDVKTANRGEREWLNMVNASEQGYENTYTTDFSAAKKAMRAMYSKD